MAGVGVTPLMARFRAKGSLTRQDKLECARTLDDLHWMVTAMANMTDAERNAAATRKAELMKEKTK